MIAPPSGAHSPTRVAVALAFGCVLKAQRASGRILQEDLTERDDVDRTSASLPRHGLRWITLGTPIAPAQGGGTLKLLSKLSAT